MRKYVTLEQFTEHHCAHWELNEEGEFCLKFDSPIDLPMLDCSPYCLMYQPWDCTLEALLNEVSYDQTSQRGMLSGEVAC